MTAVCPWHMMIRMSGVGGSDLTKGIGIEHRLGDTESRPSQVIFATESYQGPIPPPDLIAAYEEAIPDGGKQVLGLANTEQTHRHRLEERQLEAAISAQRLVHILTFLLTLVIILGGFYLVEHNKEIGGYIAIAVAASGILRSTFEGMFRKESPPPSD